MLGRSRVLTIAVIVLATIVGTAHMVGAAETDRGCAALIDGPEWFGGEYDGGSFVIADVEMRCDRYWAGFGIHGGMSVWRSDVGWTQTGSVEGSNQYAKTSGTWPMATDCDDGLYWVWMLGDAVGADGDGQPPIDHPFISAHVDKEVVTSIDCPRLEDSLWWWLG